MDKILKESVRASIKSTPIPEEELTLNVTQNDKREIESKQMAEREQSRVLATNEDIQEQEEYREAVFNSKVKQFIEISKYFSSPLKKTASYMCENDLVSFPSRHVFEYKRGGITTQHIQFSNLALEPVYIKLYKLIPELEQIKFINLPLSRTKRIPPGLSSNLGFVYDDANDKPSCNAKVVIVASRNTTTPCYQICEIELIMSLKKVMITK